jgi:hypothetical protein
MWFTDTQITALPAFSGLSPEQIVQLAADAGTLYAYLQQNPGIADGDVRAWGEGNGWGPERFNLACQALRQSGKAVDISAGPLVPPAPSSAPGPASTLSEMAAAGGDSVPTSALTADELRRVAKRMGLDLPKAATKAEMAEAISRAS